MPASFSVSEDGGEPRRAFRVRGFFLTERIFSCLSRTSFASAVFSPHAVQPPCRVAQRRYAGMCALFLSLLYFYHVFVFQTVFFNKSKTLFAADTH